MTDPTPKPEPIPSDAQTVQWEASTAMALRVLRVLAEVTTSGELASSGYLRKRCGLSAEEWHGSGELMASLICFASDKGFLKWHARDMVDATSDPKPEPQVSELEDRIADAVIDFYSNHSSDGLELYAPAFTRVGLKFAISTSGLAELEAECANRGKYIEEYANPQIRDLEARLEAAEQRWKDATEWCSGEFPCEASTHAAEFERERGAARGHVRDHHIEACETCIAIETERNEVAARLEEVAVVLKRMARSDFNPTRQQLRSAVRLATKGEGDG